MNEVQRGNIVSVQISVQHDFVVATTVHGHRLACPIRDDEFEAFLMRCDLFL